MQLFARRDDVEAALTSPALSVALTEPPEGGAQRLQAQMARFSDGEDHARRRALVQARLSGLSGLEQASAQRTAGLLRARTTPFDVMPLARTVPVAVLAAALGFGEVQIEPVTSLVAALCDALAPSVEPRPLPDDIDVVAAELIEQLRALGSDDDEHVAAALSVLFQARDATAALIGATLLAEMSQPNGSVDPWVESALRRDAPVQCTRRVALSDVVIGGISISKGSAVLVMLDSPDAGYGTEPATFGAGPHACPGSRMAREIARGCVSAIQAGWRPVPEQPGAYEPRPNLRLLAQLMVEPT